MPVKLGSNSTPATTEARIEIIPLIDIMFFLLAAFMLVSLSLANLKRINLDLPAASTATREYQSELVSLSVDKSGVVYLNKSPVGAQELASLLKSRKAAGDKMRVIISGDKDARHGDMIRVLDIVRVAGIYHVAFEIDGALVDTAGGKGGVIKK